ncbi:MAG: hypothetical protein M3Q58_12170 [Bacteroidota bacterium]|nr:hypothetical protein [Bacteroidota bacterium]
MKQNLLFKLSFLVCLFFISFNLNAQVIEQTAKNQVAENTVAFTYKLKDAAVNNSVKDDVVQNDNQEKKEITFFIDKFLKTTGVSEASFDKATQTFTVVATPQTKLNITYTNNSNHE